MINSPVHFCEHMLLQKFVVVTSYTGTFRLDVFQGNYSVFYQVNVLFSLQLKNNTIDVTIIQICEIIGFVIVFRKKKMKKAPLQKNQLVSANWWVDIRTSLF